jgi:uncharacterized protein involved in outer membrane biogenesis
VAGVLTASITGTLQGSTATELLTQSRLQANGQIERLRLPQLGEHVPRATLDASLAPDRDLPLRVVAEGQMGELPLRLTATGGSAGSIAQNEGEYPLTVEARLGESTATANASLALPLATGRFTANVTAEGPDPAPVLALFDLPERELPAYRIAGKVSRREEALRLQDLEANLGDSNLRGDLVVNLGGSRPAISGELRSSRLDADDFGGLGGAKAEAEEKVEEAAQDGQVIPEERIELSPWQQVDLDLALHAEQVQAPPIPFDAFDLDVSLQDGRLRVDPLTLRVGEGRVQGRVEFDASDAPAEADVDLELLRLPVARLINRLDVDVAAFGTLSGRARGGVGMEGYGLSVQQILGNTDGEVTLVMQGGAIDRTLVTAAKFDLLGLFGSFLNATPEQVELRCTLADLAIQDGIVETRALVVDTPIADIGGDGTVNLETEAINLELLARPDDTATVTERTGITITGTLADPEISVDPLTVAARGAAAATFGVLLKPFTALAGALGGDGDEDNPCNAVLAQPEQGQ